MSLALVVPLISTTEAESAEPEAVVLSLAFLLLNAAILLAIWWWSTRRKRPSRHPAGPSVSSSSGGETAAGGAVPTPGAPRSAPGPPPDSAMSATDVLGWEFEYARTTASEAMQDRHTMVNFYLFITGIIGSGVVAIVSATDQGRLRLATVLLWLLCGVGWLYFLKLVKLRQAWHDSARAMNQIKAFYISNTALQGADLRDAFRWKPETLPPAGQPWTVFAYSASLIAFLDSAAFVGGGLLWTGAATAPSLATLLVLAAFGIAFFILHLKLYFLFLREPR